MRFARDRLVEMYFWMTGIVFETFYSKSRIMLTKLVLYMALLDGIYDNYGTTEESTIFTTSLERWNKKTAEHIPAYLREFYKIVLCTIDDVVADLKRQNNEHAELAKEMLGMPSTDWALTYPKLVKGLTVIARVMNDIVSHEREQASDHMASTEQTCMKQYGVTVEEAIEKLKIVLEEAWMDMMQDYLDQKYPMTILKKGFSFGQSIDFFYKLEDLYTLPSNLKGALTSLFMKFA